MTKQSRQLVAVLVVFFACEPVTSFEIGSLPSAGPSNVQNPHARGQRTFHHPQATTRTSPRWTPQEKTTSWATTRLGCQLLGMNCATPTDFTFSFQGFCRRGGDTDIHSDGWGVAFYQDEGVRQFHDVEGASQSPLAGYLASHPIRTLNMMGHIRYATQGQVNLSNVHPFCRELWGIPWLFCHNGEVPLFTTAHLEDGRLPQLTSLGRCTATSSQDYYHPIGSTDSEATFCAILNALRCQFQTLPSLPILYDAIHKLCEEIAQYDPDGTILNFLLTCGPHTQWVYSWPGSRPGSKVWNGLHYAVREYPFSKVHLRDVDYSVDFATHTAPEDCVSVIATQPLTDDEEWTELQRGELIVFDQGQPYQTPYDLFKLELSGHGLQSTVLEKTSLALDMQQFQLAPSNFQGECI